MDLATELKAGREMDALVAERLGLQVLGEAICCCPEGDWYVDSAVDGYKGSMGHVMPVYFKQCHCERLDEGDKEMAAECPHLIEAIAENRRERRVLGHDAMCLEPVEDYSTSIAAAWELVEHMQKGWEVAIFERKPLHDWVVRFERSHACHYGSADTAPLAICLAFLKAMEGEG